MNEIKITMFNQKQTESEDFYEGLSKIDGIVRDALENSPNDLTHSLKMVEYAFSGIECQWIKHCVTETVMRWWMLSRATEKDVYEWFKQNYRDVLGDDYEIADITPNEKHRPDFFVSHEKKILPVECKLGSFDKSALKQLERYMRFYKCEKGIAVANELKCKLPENVTFIRFQTSELVPADIATA